MVTNIKRKNQFFKRFFGKTKGDKIFSCFNYLFFLLVAFVTFYPFYYVVKTSLKVHNVSSGVAVVVYNFNAYKTIFENDGIVNAFLLTIAVVAIHCIAHVAVTVISAYPLSRKHLRGRTGILLFIVFTMLFSGGLIPYYILIRDLGLRDNFLVYVIPGLVSPFNVIIAKNFFQGIPDSLEESAKIDGANAIVILFKIYLPLSMPILMTIMLWAGVGKWNDWMTGLLYISNKDLLLIQNYLRQILNTASSSSGTVVDPTFMNMAEGVKMAAIVVATLPIVMIYPFVQKYFVKGVLLGSVKG